MQRNVATGIDVGTTAVKVVVSEYVRGERGPEKRVIGLGLGESLGLRHGYIVDTGHVARSVRQALAHAEHTTRMKVKGAIVSVGGVGLESFTTTGGSAVSRADSEITELDIERALVAARQSLPDPAKNNRKVIHTIPLSYKLDGKEVLGRILGMRGMKLEVKTLFITTLDQHLGDLIEAIESVGVEVKDIVASPIAAAVATLTKAQRIAGCVLADIGAETVSVVVYENDMPISLKVFPLGSSDITNDIALGLRVPLEEAERIKTGDRISIQHPKKKLDEIVNARLKDIFELIETHLKKIGKNGLLPAGVVLTGGGSRIASVEDLAKASLALPSRIGSVQIGTASQGVIDDPSWATAYGLSLLGLTPGVVSGADPAGRGNHFELFKGLGENLRRFTRKFLP
jgi:cell division protein FtsA